MGAEMLITSIAFRSGKTQAQFKRIVAGVLDRAKKKIEALRTMDDLGDYEEHFGCSDADENESLEKIRQTLLADLEEVRWGILGRHREACLIEGGRGVLLLASGGSSWGDEPSRLFGSIDRLHAAGVIEDARYPDKRGLRRAPASRANAPAGGIPELGNDREDD